MGQSDSGADSTEIVALKDRLEAEKTANSQLEERVSAIKEKQEQLVAGLESEVSKLRAELSGYDGGIHKVKVLNRRLRDNNRALREANKRGVSDIDLINEGMVAELDGLRECRETDRSELDAILSELKPLLEGGANA